MKQTVTLAGTSVVSFMAPSKVFLIVGVSCQRYIKTFVFFYQADWHVIEASIRPILPSVVTV